RGGGDQRANVGGRQLGSAPLQSPAGPRREPDASGHALEPYLVALAAVALVGTRGDVRTGELRRRSARLPAAAPPTARRARGRLRRRAPLGWPPRVEHRATRADRAVRGEPVVTAEERGHPYGRLAPSALAKMVA